MATESDHIACANRTQKTIAHLLADPAVHSPWIATAAFYKALHVVEAVFFNDRQIGHCSDHSDREYQLKRHRRYEHLSQHYLPLARAATVARYLVAVDCFDTYLEPAKVVEKLLKHHLRQVESSARGFLKAPASLVGIETAFTLPTGHPHAHPTTRPAP
jgi:hypothetical protein